jgi:uncharacterized membrane protein (DUF485 family)
VSGTHQRSGHQVYEDLHASPDFSELRRRFRSFVFPYTAAFLAWYLLYVAMSIWAKDFMSTELLGNINVAMVFGLLQFATTFGIAWRYSRYSAAKLDPLAGELQRRYDEEMAK